MRHGSSAAWVLLPIITARVMRIDGHHPLLTGPSPGEPVAHQGSRKTLYSVVNLFTGRNDVMDFRKPSEMVPITTRHADPQHLEEANVDPHRKRRQSNDN
jgi:hypothetical protein